MSLQMDSQLVPWWGDARAHLLKHRVLGPVVRGIDADDGLRIGRDFTLVLVRTICGQHVSNAVAEKTTEKVVAAAGGGSGLELAHGILGLTVPGLHALGMSTKKCQALDGLCRMIADGTLSRDVLWPLSDEEAAARLQLIPGFGPWSATMLLIFGLGRPDVWAGRDLGVRQALVQLGAMEADMYSCKPFRTAATWYLWRIRKN